MRSCASNAAAALTPEGDVRDPPRSPPSRPRHGPLLGALNLPVSKRSAATVRRTNTPHATSRNAAATPTAAACGEARRVMVRELKTEISTRYPTTRRRPREARQEATYAGRRAHHDLAGPLPRGRSGSARATPPRSCEADRLEHFIESSTNFCSGLGDSACTNSNTAKPARARRRPRKRPR